MFGELKVQALSIVQVWFMRHINLPDWVIRPGVA